MPAACWRRGERSTGGLEDGAIRKRKFRSHNCQFESKADISTRQAAKLQWLLAVLARTHICSDHMNVQDGEEKGSQWQQVEYMSQCEEG